MHKDIHKNHTMISDEEGKLRKYSTVTNEDVIDLDKALRELGVPEGTPVFYQSVPFA